MSLVPVYQYRNTQGINSLLHFFYTTLGTSLDGSSWNSVPSDDVSNWQCDGIAFYGCGQNDPGAVAYYEYWAWEGNQANLKSPADSLKYLYVPSNTVAGGGWNLAGSGPAFYAYGQNDGGLAQFMIYYTASPEYNYGLFCNLASAVTGNFSVPQGWQGAGWIQGPWPFYALPGEAQLVYTLQGIDIVPPLPGTGQPAMVGTQMVTNNSKNASVSQDVAFGLQLMSSFTLTFQETLSVTDTKTMEFGIPDLGKIGESLSVGISLSSSQAQTQSTQKSVQISSTVTVPQNSAVTVAGIVYVVEDYSPPNNPITINVDMTSASNDVILTQVYATPAGGKCTALQDLFSSQNPSFSGTVTANQPAPGSIEVSLSCYITANFGVNTELVVDDNTAANVWQPGTSYVFGQTIYDGACLQECTSPGTSGASAPTWNDTLNGTTNDGSVVWTCQGSTGVSEFALHGKRLLSSPAAKPVAAKAKARG